MTTHIAMKAVQAITKREVFPIDRLSVTSHERPTKIRRRGV
ncbi:hypothetical protein RRSWK_03911 [Rhodopirellula sp. SWK7]|nr:hypothetical protein RRSWK_03911 [Rhodopirellula sp. SWK7]